MQSRVFLKNGNGITFVKTIPSSRGAVCRIMTRPNTMVNVNSAAPTAPDRIISGASLAPKTAVKKSGAPFPKASRVIPAKSAGIRNPLAMCLSATVRCLSLTV
ncbi:hypothetical protein PSACC_00367 [Paramicrosporidium saccamoebae]|uniref:Uncharacterized protein n=1 Tax=Paramicrosporidium saccamoebae TaxID=1246581 RepID=A0A2H9TPU7_9FUNG|nr:hypothetical protein PSACC_00367 [Paramicrosporidium saccamoebae]